MSTMAVKLRRDLWAVWPRMLAMVVAIAVSLTVFGAVLYTWSALSRETSGAYMSTEPASATFVLETPLSAEAATEAVTALQARPEILTATARTQFTSDIERDGQLLGDPIQVFVAAPGDPMNVARLGVDDAWPPAPGEILLGEDSLGLLGLSIGDTITVDAPTGAPVSLRIAGTVYDPSLAPAPQEQAGHGYLSAASLPDAGMDQLKIQIAEPGGTVPSADRERIVASAAETAAWLRQELSVEVSEIQVPTPYAHPHQWQSDALMAALLAGGSAALLLSAILVANMLGGLFTRHIPQIGIMKAIGARAGRVGRFYLAMTLLVAALATAVAFVPAVLIGRAGLDVFTDFLGVKAVSLAAPWWAYAIIAAAGLVLPPLLALVPLIRAGRTTVRAAVDHHGGVPPVVTGPLGWLARLRVNRGLAMALRNTIRRPARFFLSAGLLAAAAAVFVSGMSVGAGADAIDADRRAQRTWDVDVTLSAPSDATTANALAEGVTGVTGVEGWARLKAAVAFEGKIPLTRTYPDQGHGRITLAAFPGDSAFPVPEVLEGRWLEPGETGAVVINQVTRTDSLPGVRPGDTIELYLDGEATTWTVAGIVEELEAAGGVYTTAQGLAAALGGAPVVNQLRVTTDDHDEQARESIATAVGQALNGNGIAVQSAASVSRADAISAGHMGPLITILLTIAVAMGIVGGIGLASTMSANVLDRIREFGIMHAIGARPRTVRRIVITEGILLALASCIVAIPLTLGLTALLGAGLGNLFMKAPLPYRISVPAVVIWLALVILGAALATDAAATRASKTTVREALSYL